MMVSGSSRGTMVVYSTINVFFTESIIFILVKSLMLILILVYVDVHISMTDSNASSQSTRTPFKLLTTSGLKGS